MPADSFYASGNFGQRVVIVPAVNLVIVQFGQSHGSRQDIQGLLRLTAEVSAFLRQP
jgi:CubicO group peptidase (beta-lactamase class C family)